MLCSRRFLALAVALVAFVAAPTAAYAHDDGSDAIDVCCAWNSELNDGVLTYKITGGTELLRAAAAAGVEMWDGIEANGKTLTLTEVTGNGKANLSISLKPGGSPFTAGQTNRKFQRIRAGGPAFAFFVMKGASISIFGASPGNEDDVEKTTAHEVGHGLGAGHANAAHYLMSTSLAQIDSSTPTQCDIDAVVAAQHWYFTPGARLQPPVDDHVHC